MVARATSLNVYPVDNPRRRDRRDVPDRPQGTTTDPGAYKLQAGLPDALLRNGFE